MTAAECAECGWSGELTKEPDEYENGPRCGNPDCRSRDIDLQVGEPEPRADPVEAEVISMYRDGQTPLDVVEAGIVSIDEAEKLREKFNQVSDDFLLITGESLEDHRKDAFARGREQGRKEARAEAADAYEQGKSEAWNQALMAVRMGLQRG